MDHTTRRLGFFAAAAASASLFALSAACGRSEEPKQPPKQTPPPAQTPAPTAPEAPKPTDAPPATPKEGAAGAPPAQSAGDPSDVFEILPREKTEPLRGDPIVHTRFAIAKGIRYTIPRGWVVEAPSNSMRLSQYRLPAPKDSGLPDGVVVVSGGIGGSVDDNLKRWAAQMKDGKKKPTRKDLMVGDLIVYQIEATGTYDPGMSMPGAPPAEPLKDAMMLGAIIDNGPDGLVFIKATGPAAVMEPLKPTWDTLTRSVAVKSDSPNKGVQH